MKRQKVIFIHIPKTGGTTLKNIAARQYPPSETFFMDFSNGGLKENFNRMKQKDDLKFVVGHLGYGSHRDIEPDFNYITFIRNPVELVVSDFCFKKEEKDHHRHRAVSGMSLSEYLESDMSRRNMLTSFLSQHNRENYQKKEMRQDTVSWMKKPVDEEDFKEALDVLENRLLIFGITEKFDESMVLLREVLNWQFLYYRPLLVTKSKTKPSADEISRIKQLNRFDMALYDRALSLFEKRISTIENFEKKMRTFRYKNRIFGPPSTFLFKFLSKVF